MCFYGKLHRQFIHHFFGIAVDDESYRIFDTYSTLTAIEELILVDLRGRGLMLHRSRRIRDDHIGESMRSALIAEQEAVALAVVTRIDGFRSHLHESAVRILAVSGGDTFGDNTATGVLADMNHLRARIGLLVVVRHRHRVKLRRRVIAA